MRRTAVQQGAADGRLYRNGGFGLWIRNELGRSISLWFPCGFRYNDNYLQQVEAMEARAKAVGAAGVLHYLFPSNGGMNAADAAKVWLGVSRTRCVLNPPPPHPQGSDSGNFVCALSAQPNPAAPSHAIPPSLPPRFSLIFVHQSCATNPIALCAGRVAGPRGPARH